MAVLGKDIKVGIVKWFDEKKGFGFITPVDDPDTDVFVHYSAVPGMPGRRNLLEGDRVTYLEGKRDNGMFAVTVLTVVRS